MNPEPILEQLSDGPKSIRELGISSNHAFDLALDKLVTIDPDQFPGEYVPGNPMILRLPNDTRNWPGWKEWNL